MRANDDIVPHDRQSDPDLAQRFDLLYRDQAGQLRRRVRAQVGSSEDASDLVQEAFSRLLGAGSAKALRNPAAFLNRIVRNLLIDRNRRVSARPPHIALETGTDLPVPPDQSDALDYEQMKQRYRIAVDGLPPRMREVFILHRVEELSYREIAGRLDISVRTVEWHIAQAIVRIAEGLDAK